MQGGQNKQVSLVTKRLVNLATNQPTNAPANPDLGLGLTCEASPRIVVYDSANGTIEAVLATSTPVLGSTTGTDPVVVDSNPHVYTLLSFTFNDTDAADVGDDVSGIDAGEVQLVYRSRTEDLVLQCKRAHINSISGWLSFHDTDPQNNQLQTTDPGVIIRGVINAVPPNGTFEE